MIKLFLDDIRLPSEVSNYFTPVKYRTLYRKEGWIIVRNYNDFVNYIESNELPELISFDHDLADDHYDPSTWTESFEYHEKTGYHCALYLLDYCYNKGYNVPQCLCHSMNPVGKKRIEDLLKINY